MKIEENYSLKNHNTFNVDVKAKLYTEITSIKDCLNVLEKYPKEKILVLGDGSNTLLIKDWEGIVIRPIIKTIRKVKENEQFIYIESGSGTNWDHFVRYCVANNYAGIENLVMIPGTVGGAVAQNIAAYGQNITDTLVSVRAVDIKSKKKVMLLPEECGYEYRRSNFKNKWRYRYIITSAVFQLRKNTKEFELSYHERAGRYGSILEELNSFAEEPYTIQDVMQAVINQRTKRLPSVDEYGTCGSFFENPVVPIKKYEELSKVISELQCYPVEDLRYHIKDWKEYRKGDFVKIPAGRILDELGWRGQWIGNVGVSEKHALCVVSNKEATGKEILDFVHEMQKDVKLKYDIDLISEVNIIE